MSEKTMLITGVSSGLGKTLAEEALRQSEINADPERSARTRKFITEGLRGGILKPIIAKTFKLEQIVEAHRYMESNEQIGKIVVTV